MLWTLQDLRGSYRKMGKDFGGNSLTGQESPLGARNISCLKNTEGISFPVSHHRSGDAKMSSSGDRLFSVRNKISTLRRIGFSSGERHKWYKNMKICYLC